MKFPQMNYITIHFVLGVWVKIYIVLTVGGGGFWEKKFTTDLKLGEFRKEWNEFGEHIKSACCFMALAGQKKKQNKRLFKELQCFFLCFFRNLRIFRSEIGGRRNWQNSDAERRKCQLKHILKVKIGWLYSQCQKEKCENRPWGAICWDVPIELGSFVIASEL